MSVGKISLRAILDEPLKIHYGSAAPVTGRVDAVFQPSAKHVIETTGELFGPLRITITLHGRCKTKIWKRSGNHTHVYRGRVPLFAIQKTILESQFRAQPHKIQQFPFEINFPSRLQSGFYGDWELDQKYQAQELLPPSFTHHSHGFGHHFESFIEYRIGAAGVMPNIKVDIVNLGKYEEPVVRYERPKLLPPVSGRLIEGKGQVSISNEMLVPEEQRPTGFKQKMKVALTSNNFPRYTFGWRFVGPQCIHLLEPITFNVAIKPMMEQCTAPLVPDVTLLYFALDVKANTFVRADRQLFSSPEADTETTLATISGRILDKGPFSKENDWTKTVNIGRFTNFPTQFSTPNICRTYNVKINIHFKVAGEDKEFSQRFPIALLPPLQSTDLDVGSSGGVATIASAGAGGARMNEDDAILPAYEPPPTYEGDLKT